MKKFFWAGLSLLFIAASLLAVNKLWNIKIDSRIVKFSQGLAGNVTPGRPIPSQGSDTTWGSATTTNLYVSGTSNLGGALTFTTASGTTLTSTNIFANSKISVNSSSPIASIAMQSPAGIRPVQINSSTGAQLLRLDTNGQFVLGPNTLAQTGAVVVSHSTGNTIALSFTDDTNYTALLGRPAGTSAQMAVGGNAGTSFNALANGTVWFSILNSGFAGFGTTTPIDDVAMSGSASTTLVIDSTSVTQGACIMLKDSDGSGYTYVTGNNGVLTASATSCR